MRRFRLEATELLTETVPAGLGNSTMEVPAGERKCELILNLLDDGTLQLSAIENEGVVQDIPTIES